MRVLIVALLAGACSQPPDWPIRDVRPQKIESGEPIVIEGRGFDKAAPETLVVFEGELQKPAVAAKPVKLTFPARVAATDRVLLDADATVQRAFGRGEFVGRVTVVQGKNSFPSSDRVPFRLSFFPPSMRKALYGAIDARGAGLLSEWLGLEVKDAPGGAAVVAVVAEFDPESFFNTFEKPPIDGKVSKTELAGAELGDQYALYRFADDNGDGLIERHEAENHEREAGFAARAGLRPGDLIVKAAGRPIGGASDFWAAWHTDVSSVDVEAKRGGPQGQAIYASLPRHGGTPTIPDGFLAVGGPIAAALLVFMLLGPFSGLIVVAERKISGQMQSRIGPNRVGPQGLLQWLADGIKLITKEDLVPTDADSILFRMAPYFVWVGIFATFVVLPFSQSVIIADMNIGILYLVSITALVVVGIIMGGWASNSKWSLLGGMRSAAQIISYEIPASVAILTAVIVTGTLSPQAMVAAQGGAPWSWNVFDNPAVFACFFIYFISALAEGNRTPFDLPEAESELVAGYNTEYSGFRFGVFFLAEWTNLYVISAIATTIFLGGWRLPGVSPLDMESGARPSMLAIGVVAAALALVAAGGWFGGRVAPFMRRLWWVVPVIGAFLLGAMLIGYQALGFAMFFLKALTLVFVIIWVRWTLPRFRVDQMMSMCWKYFIPLSFACVLLAAGWTWLAPNWMRIGMRWLMFATFGVGLLAFFISRVVVSMRVHKTRLWDPFARNQG